MARNQTQKKQVNNITHRYILEPYRSPSSRIDCPNCNAKHSYARFIDIETGEHLEDNFGRCDRVEKCGYFNTPYGQDINNKSLMVPILKVLDEYQDQSSGTISLISLSNVFESLTFNDNFSNFLKKTFGFKAVESLIKYKIGESNKWKGSTVFWQIDQDSDVRTGKIILYGDNGKRIKEPFPRISWEHVPDKKLDVIPDYNLKQCLFGEHLITEENQIYNIVEAEKTAIICDISSPPEKGIWLSVGGIELISEEKLKVLENKTLNFFPDKGDKAYTKWSDKLKPFTKDWNITINRGLEKSDLEDGSDLADLILSKLK